jgi:hypothetical protein
VIVCRRCRQSFVSSLAPAVDLCSECYERSHMSRAEAAVPEHGRHAGKAPPTQGFDRLPPEWRSSRAARL